MKIHFIAGSDAGTLHCGQVDNKGKFEIEDLNILEGKEISCLIPGRSEREFLVGNSDSELRVLNAHYGSPTTIVNTYRSIGKSCPVVGAGVTESGILFCDKYGFVNICNETFFHNFQLCPGEDPPVINCMKLNLNRNNVFGEGGPNRLLKLWDLETQVCIFQSKSSGHDSLNLKQDVTCRCICFFPEPNLTASCTMEGSIFLFDDRAQRKPVSRFSMDNVSYVSLCTGNQDRECFAGTTKGNLQRIDLRSNKCMKNYSQFSGSVTDISMINDANVFGASCLDRYIRIYNGSVFHKFYVKMRLTKLLIYK